MAYSNESWIPLPMSGFGNIVVSTDLLITGFQAETISNGEVCAEYAIPYSKCILKRVAILVTEAFTAGCVIKVWNGAIADASGIATFTMGATAIDQMIYLDIEDTAFTAGQYISIEVDVQDTTTGSFFPIIMVEPTHETGANVTKMITTGGAAGAT